MPTFRTALLIFLYAAKAKTPNLDSTLEEETFAKLSLFANINFLESMLAKDFTSINFRESLKVNLEVGLSPSKKILFYLLH